MRRTINRRLTKLELRAIAEALAHRLAGDLDESPRERDDYESALRKITGRLEE